MRLGDNPAQAVRCLLAWVAAGTLVARGDVPGVAPREAWGNVEAGTNTAFHFIVKAPAGSRARFVWRLAVDGRTLDRGESEVELDAAGVHVAAVTVRAPEVEPGVAVDADLECGVAGTTGPDASKPARCVKRIRILHPDAFALRRTRLGEAGLVLFDPEATTGKRLAAAGIRFEEAHNPDALPETGGRCLLVGEGVSWRDYRGLWRAVCAAAAATNRAVLCLAPRGGEVAVPGTEGAEIARPESVTVAGLERFARLAPKLDVYAWPRFASVAGSSLHVAGRRGGVFGAYRRDAAGWTWFELRMPGGGRVLVCGLRIMEAWEATPAARYLLAALLEDMLEETSRRPGGEDGMSMREGGAGRRAERITGRTGGER